jgi:hypothetical protein
MGRARAAKAIILARAAETHRAGRDKAEAIAMMVWEGPIEVAETIRVMEMGRKRWSGSFTK